jgi:tetratricopeptide (TPR) repeat protein
MAIQNGDTCKFAEADQDWNLESLFSDIEAKQLKKVTPAQQRNLRAILLGLSPQQVSNQLRLGRKSLDPAFSALYRLIEDLTDQPDTSVTYKNAPLVLAKYRKGAAPNTKFDLLGREVDRQKLEEFIKQYKIVLIKAGAGVGKSTLAREFLQTQFKKVIRIEMGLESGNVTPAEEKVSQILRKDFDEEPSRDFGINLGILGEKLADRTNPIGVLIDNLEPALDENYRFRDKLRGYDALLAVLGDRDVFSFTLITSRRSLIAQRVRVHEYSLEGLDITAWRQYFHDCENGVDSEALLQMCVAYNGNAKVMDILHGAIKNRFDGNIGAYWNRYKDALLADSELETLISVEMDWLRDNQPDAYKLLCRMGCYRYQDVKTIPFEGLICMLWDVSESQRIGVVDYLSKNSLIEAKGEYYLHPAIRELAKLCLLKNTIDWEKANQQAANFWVESVEIIRSINDVMKLMEAYYHYINVSDFISAGKILILQKKQVNERENVSIYFGTLLFQYGILLDSSLFNIENIIEHASTEPYVYACLHNILGNHYTITGNIKKAICFHSQCLESANKNNLDFLINASLINLGHIYLQLLEIEKAITFLEELSPFSKVSSICKRQCTKFEFESYAYMAYAKSLQENLKDANKLADIFLNTSKPNDLRTYNEAYAFTYLGRSYIQSKNFETAKYALNIASKIAKEYSFPEVLGIVYVLESKINYYEKNFGVSIFLCQSAIEILEKIFAICEMAEAYFQLGLTYQAMGEHDQAEEYKAKALELFAQMEAPKQIERVNKAFGGNI